MNKVISKKFASELVEVEAAPDDSGQFTALVSVFGVLDSQGDIIDPGSFSGAVKRVEAGEIMPIVWSHDYANPYSIIGEVIALRETAVGLEVDAVLDLADSELAREVHRHMLKGRIREFSIGGEVTGWEMVSPPTEKSAGGSATPEFHITELNLWEVGPCFKGANPATELVSVKAREAQKDEVGLAEQHVEMLREMYRQLGTVLAAVESAPEGDNEEEDADEDGEAQAVKSAPDGACRMGRIRAALRLIDLGEE